MPSLTTNYSLNKPLVNNATDQDLWGGYINDNMDTIDTQLLLCRDWKKRDITTTDSVVAGDRHKILLCNATGGAFTLTMLAAATAADGFQLTIVKTDATANAVTLDGNASETIGGATTFALSGQGDAATLVCDGSNWHFQGNKTTPSAVPSASTSAAGIIEVATAAEVRTGTSTSLAVTPGDMKTALGFSTYYDSGSQTVSDSDQVLLTHSLGAIPKLAIFELVCAVTDLGYAVGDRLPLAALTTAITGTDPSVTVGYNTTQIFINFGSELRLTPQGGGESETITNSSWRVAARAWA